MPQMQPIQYLELLKRLKSERSNYDSTWQDLAKYCIPRKAYITREKTPGTHFDYDVFDSTAMQSTLTLAAGLHSYLTNPSTRWFTLEMENPKLRKQKEVKVWLAQAEEEIYYALNHSNFSEQIHESYLDLTVFGTSCLYEEEDPKDRIRFYTRPIKECYVMENGQSRIDTLIRTFDLTVRQAWDLWGKDAGKATTKYYEAKQFEKKVTFVHVVAPREVFDSSKEDAQNMPYGSYYLEPEDKKIIAESGYREFPFMIPRFNKESGETYGTSPAMTSFPDIKMLNEMDKTIIRAAQKVVDPPLMLPHDGYLLPIKLGPGAINYKVRGSSDDKLEPILTHANIPVGLEMEEQRRLVIRRNFFVDLFLLLADPARKNMTATEVMQRVEEKMLILAPTLGRLMNELLDPVINRTFNILVRRGFIKEIPSALQGETYKIVYTSPLARAQRLEEMKSINTVMALIGQTSAVAPQIIDKIDTDEFVDVLAEIYQITPKLIRDDKEVQAIREARAKAQQEAAQMQKLAAGAEIAKTGSEAARNLQGE